MPKSEKQKQKILYLLKILTEQSDENHVLSMAFIIDELAKYDISAERKSIYRDMEELCDFGYDIIQKKGKNGGYYLADREFELAELKVLVDAVLASKFITVKKSNELISKITHLAGVNGAKQLNRQVYVLNRIKAENESIYYNVDDIHRSIQENVQISFRYLEYMVDKKQHFRNDGKIYVVSPWALIWNEENYYLIAYDSKADVMKHFRVDKMKDITLTSQNRMIGKKYENFDPAKYCRKTFGMFGGENELVSILFPNRLAGVVIDRFGRETELRTRDENHFSIRVSIALSEQFYGWLSGLGNEVKIIGPQAVIQNYKEYLNSILNAYGE